MEKLKKLLDESISFSEEEKVRLYAFFQQYPDRLEQGIQILEQERELFFDNQKKYFDQVMHIADEFIADCAKKDKEDKKSIYTSSRVKVKQLLDAENKEKNNEISDLDTILNSN